MDVPDCEIIFIDDNEISLREQVLSKIIAAALLDKVWLHIKEDKVQDAKES